METVIVLIVVGAALLLLETVLPGMVAGVLGLCSLIAGVVLGYLQGGPRIGNFILIAVLAGLVVGTLLYLRYFPTSRAARLFVSQGKTGELGVEHPELLHQTGTSCTPLRPSGAAIINGHRVDVVAEGTLIERGTPIKVMLVEGSRVVVRAIETKNSSSQTQVNYA